MKRSENVSLVLMGAVAFAATFAGGMAYLASQKPSHAAQAQTAVADQSCTTRSDGTQDCQPQRRGFAYYFYPRFSGWTWSSGWGGGASSEPIRRDAALGGSRASYAPAPAGGVVRSGFGSSARGSFRISAGG
jgi:hypothetical protein